MLYDLFNYLDQTFDLPGAQLFRFISFRAAMAILLSLVITMVLGKRIIAYLQKKQVGESIRDLGLEGQNEKAGTPTMGGLIILAAVIVPILLFARLSNIYILLMLAVTVILGIIGFMDDYIKVFRKNKKGLAGRFKIMGQVLVGILVGATIYFHPDVQIRDFSTIYKYEVNDGSIASQPAESYPASGENLGNGRYSDDGLYFLSHDVHSNKTTIPFLKNNEFDYNSLLFFLGEDAYRWGWLIYIPIVILIITAVSNGANLTDGLDGLATGVSAVVIFTLLVFAYVSGNVLFADYLNIIYIPHSGELVIFAAAFVGACVGFLWYNSYPASVFMGDTGSLAIGGIIATLAIVVRKELLLPLLCGIFLIESLSVIIQVAWFKYTRRKYGEGRRIFLMSPLHHHYQKKGLAEPKIVVRFWIVSIMLAVLSVITLKVR